MGHHPWCACVTRAAHASCVSGTFPCSYDPYQARVRARSWLIIGPEWNTPRHEHFVDHSFADDLVELILHLPPQCLQPRLRSAPELLRITLRYDRTNAVFNQGLALFDCRFDALFELGLGDCRNGDIVEEGSAGLFVGSAEVEDLDFDAFPLVDLRAARGGAAFVTRLTTVTAFRAFFSTR